VLGSPTRRRFIAAMQLGVTLTSLAVRAGGRTRSEGFDPVRDGAR
jgi:hypothetical protein